MTGRFRSALNGMTLVTLSQSTTMKKTTTHRRRRLIDYGITAALLAVPLLLKLNRKAGKVSAKKAINKTLFNGLSKTSVSIKSASPSNSLHNLLDTANLVRFIALSKTNNTSGTNLLSRIFKAILLAGCVHILLRDHRNKNRFTALHQKSVTHV